MGRLTLAVAAIALCAALPVDAQSGDPRPLVAVLVPLTGEFDAVGMRAWQAVAMAAAQGGDMRLLRFDTNESGPAAAWQAAVESGAHAILGPIGDAESRVVAQLAAGGDGPPVFLLNGTHGIERHGARVFRARTSPANQAEALAGTTLAAGEVETFAVFAPDDAYGDEAAAAFVEAVDAYGGRVLRVVRYPSDERDVSEALSLLVGASSARLAEPTAPWTNGPEVRIRPGGGDTTRPDALFLPDYADQVSAILPHLEFHGWLDAADSAGVRLLGLSGWVSSDLERVADLAAGSTVVQVYDPEGLDTAGEAFALEWGVRFDEPPTAFEAQVSDAAHFVFAVLRASSDLGPDAVAAAALAAPPMAGACGDMWFDADGGVVRQLGLWEVDGGGTVYPVGVVEPPRDRVPR